MHLGRSSRDFACDDRPSDIDIGKITKRLHLPFDPITTCISLGAPVIDSLV